MRAEVRYRAAAAADLVRVELDELTAVFDRRSGQTHLLASPLPEMLDALGDAEWALAAFVEHLASDFEISSAPAEVGVLAASTVRAGQGSGLCRSTEVEALIAARMAELVALGLVEAR